VGEPSNKVLVVASLEGSRVPAYALLRGLSECGYSGELCCAEGEDGKPVGKIIPGEILSSEVECDPFAGVVFMDDGGDPKAAVSLAKRADKADGAVAGYGSGCTVLSEAGLLKGRFVPAGLPEEISKGSKRVKSPAVKSDNIVACSGGCVDGFVLLVVDALGGEIKRTVTSGKETVASVANSCLVVSRLGRWPEYWDLADRLCRSGATLLLADWRDMDARRGVLSQHLLFEPRLGRVVLVRGAREIPRSTWFKQTSIGTEETISAIEALEKAGCRNVNSSEAVRLATNKAATIAALAGACAQGSFEEFGPDGLDGAVSKAFEPGTRWIKPVDGSLGEKVVRVRGSGGGTVLLSRRASGSPSHAVMDREGLRKVLAKFFAGRRFMVQEDLGSMRVGDVNFELRFLMRRGLKGWSPSAEIARGGNLVSNPSRGFPVACSAAQAAKLVFGSGWEGKLGQAREVAEAACIAFQSVLKDPEGVGELGVDMTFSKEGPKVVEINSVPDLTFVDKAILGAGNLSLLAKSAGMDEPDGTVTQEQMESSRAGISDILSPDPKEREKTRAALGRELGHLGIHPQGDGTVEIHYAQDKKKASLLEALRLLQADVAFHLGRARNANGKGLAVKQMEKILARALHHALYRFRVLRLFARTVLASSKGMIKKAEFTGEEYSYGDGTVPGPYSNVRTPTRLMEVREGDDWMEDLGMLDPDAKSWLRRYLAAKENDPMSADCNRFILMDKEHTPSPWEEYEHGQGHIPTRPELMH